MPILPSSLARAVGAGANLQSNTPSAQDIPHNIVIIGTFDPALAGGLTVETIYGPYASSGPIGTAFRNGFMIHRLAVGVFAGMPSGGATVWVIPQAEVGGAAATSTNTFAITGPATAAGTFAVYVDNIRYAIPVASGDTATTVATVLAAAIQADTTCPCSATSSVGNVTLTSKSKGPWGNSIPLAVNIIAGDALPTGIAVTVTALTSGTGVPVIANALNALGTGTNANNLPNQQWMTELVHGYLATGTVAATTLQDQTTTTAVSTYNGLASANPPTGCWDHIVGRPFRCVNGDTTNSASLPAALLSYAVTNTYDRTDGLLCVPGSRTHPCEIAAVATGVIAPLSAMTAEAPYIDLVLPGVEPGPVLIWTGDYTNRDNAVKGGISPTIVRGGYVLLQNLVTYFANNTGVPTASNGYREFCNISKLMNIVASLLAIFRGPKWTGCTIVNDSTLVTDPLSRQKVRSVDDVVDELVALVKAWEGTAWLYSAAPTIAALKAGQVVNVRAGGDGFVNLLPGILSGVLNIIDTTFNFDISLAGGGF